MKYIIFFSILCGIFFAIFRKSEKRGLRRWWTSFRTAIISDLIPISPQSPQAQSAQPFINHNQVCQERLFSESFEDIDPQITLVKEGNSGSVPISPGQSQPSVFPTSGSRGRPSHSVNPYGMYKVAPKTNQGLGAGANPAGAGGGGEASEFDDQCPVPKKEQSQESKTFDYDYRSKKKK